MCMYVCKYVRMYVCMYVCKYVCMYVCVCMYVSMYVCMCMYLIKAKKIYFEKQSDTSCRNVSTALEALHKVRQAQCLQPTIHPSIHRSNTPASPDHTCTPTWSV
jgi:hypothetical protein